MKKLTVISMLVLVMLLVFAGCNEAAEAPSNGEQETPPEVQTPDDPDATTLEAGSGYYLTIPKNSWDAVIWDRVKTPSWAWYVLIQEIGEVPVDENGNFLISYSGEFYQDDLVTVTFNQFELSGKIVDVDSFTAAPDGTEIGTGRIDMELHYRIDETDWAKPHFLDKVYTVNSDFKVIISKEGTKLSVRNDTPLMEYITFTYIESEYVNEEYQEESENTMDYHFAEEFDVVTR
jgi:hypothetical protein